jgi:hypothetical protein
MALLCATFVLGLFYAANVPAQSWRWSNPSPQGNDIYDMAWNGNLSVQVGDSGQLYTGLNFLGWEPQDSGTTNDLEAVTFFGNRILITGANGTVGYSDNGVNFSTTTLGTSNWLVGVAASPNVAVAVGDNAVIYNSATGASWHYQGQAPNANGSWLLSVAYGGGMFVATGENGYAAASTDGTNWTAYPISGSIKGFTNNLTHVTYISTTNGVMTFPYTGFWAVSDKGDALFSPAGSDTLGQSWSKFDGVLSTNVLWTVAANNTSGLLAGQSDTTVEVILGTTDISWAHQANAPASTYYVALWDSTNCAYRLGGDSGMMVDGSLTNGTYSWEDQYPSPRSLLWQVTVINGLYVAVGDDATILTSDNGGDWTTEALPMTNSVSQSNTVFFCVGGNSNMLIAAGTGGSLALSPNNTVNTILTNVDGSLSTNPASTLGVIWYSMPAPNTNDLAAVCAFGTNYYLAGGNATLLRSANGTNWTKLSVPNTVTNDLAGLAASASLMVAVGDQGVILTSTPDGTTWTKQTSPTTYGLIRVRYLDGIFLALGENGTLLSSANGSSWSTLSAGTTNWLTDAVMVSNTCYVVGNNATVLTSSDFIHWTNMPTITYHSFYGAATQYGQLVIVGVGGSILRNQIAPNLTTPVFFYDFQQSGTNAILAISGYPDQQFTLDSSTNLTNWTTGPLLDFSFDSGTLTVVTSQSTNPPPAHYYRASLVP